MMARILAFFMFLTIPATGMAQDNFSDYFRDSSLYMAFTSEAKNKRLRILTIDSLLYQPGWNGPDRLPIKSPSSSHRRILMLSGKDDTIFSHSYSSLIDEWLALGGTHRDYDGLAFSELHRLPFPKKETEIVFQQRVHDGRYATYHKETFSPANAVEMIQPAEFHAPEPHDEIPLLISGNPRHKIDLVIMSHAYGAADMHSFDSVARAFAERLFSCEPFRSCKGRFNIRMLKVYSQNALSHNTLFVSNVFGIQRYMGAWDYARAYRKALSLPCDCFVVFVNSSEYAGGGIYNHYAAFAGRNPLSVEGMMHEFGHSFANLGDEYEGDAFKSNESSESRCIMRALGEAGFCAQCQKKIQNAIDYWSE